MSKPRYNKAKAARAAVHSDRRSLICDGLGLLTAQHLMTLRDYPVLISVDFENIQALAREPQSDTTSRQMGVAILDTKDLTPSSTYESLISTHNFVSGLPKYVDHARNRFLFNETTVIEQNADLLASLRSLIPPSRKVFLISHGISNEKCALKILGFDYTIFDGFLDTLPLSKSILPQAAKYTLQGILTHLQIPFCNLHSAGNDAYFTLRCLLLLAAQTCQFDPYNGNTRTPEALVQNLEKLSSQQNRQKPHRADAPSGAIDTMEKTKKTKEKQMKCHYHGRKYQVKQWDAETQARIQEEKAAERAFLKGQSVGYTPIDNQVKSWDAVQQGQIWAQQAAEQAFLEYQNVTYTPVMIGSESYVQVEQAGYFWYIHVAAAS